MEKKLIEVGQTMDDAIQREKPGREKFGLARGSVGFLRKELDVPQEVREYPTEDDPHHALIVGEKPKKVKSQIAKHFEVVVEPQMQGNE